MDILEYKKENILLAPAGIENKKQNSNVSTCLITKNKGQTPEKLKRYRKTNLQKVGKTTLHFGNFDYVQNYPDNVCHGKKIKKLENVSNLIKSNINKGFKKIKNELKEKIYKSQIQKPYAKSLSRNYIFPEKVNKANFHFGKKTQHDKKYKIYQETKDELQKAEELYKKSHNYYKPGEQKKRDYKWPLNLDSHIFGKKLNEFENIKDCLVDKNEFKSGIKNKNFLDFEKLYKDKIGKSSTNKINPIFEFRESFPKKEIGVKECFDFQDSEHIDRNIETLGTFKKNYLSKTNFLDNNQNSNRNLNLENNKDKTFGLSTYEISCKNLNIKKKDQNEKINNLPFLELINYNYDDKIKNISSKFHLKMDKDEIIDIVKSTRYSNIDVLRVVNSFHSDKISLKAFIDRAKSFHLI